MSLLDTAGLGIAHISTEQLFDIVTVQICLDDGKKKKRVKKAWWEDMEKLKDIQTNAGGEVSQLKKKYSYLTIHDGFQAWFCTVEENNVSRLRMSKSLLNVEKFHTN